MSDVSIPHHAELSIQNYTLFLPFRDLRNDVETAAFPGEFGTTLDVTNLVMSRALCGVRMSFGFRVTLSCDVRAGFSVRIPAGFRVAYWREIGTGSRANSPASSRPRRVRGQGGGYAPRGRGGRANIHGVSHTFDALFFVEQIQLS